MEKKYASGAHTNSRQKQMLGNYKSPSVGFAKPLSPRKKPTSAQPNALKNTMTKTKGILGIKGSKTKKRVGKTIL